MRCLLYNINMYISYDDLYQLFLSDWWANLFVRDIFLFLSDWYPRREPMFSTLPSCEGLYFSFFLQRPTNCSCKKPYLIDRFDCWLCISSIEKHALTMRVGNDASQAIRKDQAAKMSPRFVFFSSLVFIKYCISLVVDLFSSMSRFRAM